MAFFDRWKGTQGLFRSLMISGLLLLALPLQADPAVKRLHDLLQQMQSLEGRFEQLTQDARGQRLQESSGVMRLQKPGRFFWETERPYPQVLVSDGSTLWVYDPDLEQVTVQALDQRVASTPALILSGESTDLTEHFRINQTRSGTDEEFRLVPRGADSLFEVLRLYFVDGRIRALQLEDSLGQSTRVELYIEQYNQPMAAHHFTFEIPAGVDVIQEQ
ncbi:outer membrane lipoprotein chaperone LolA [Marinospirillum alkaliphilum]|uniref:Outer-membrane lipoprotein carrier protein n=1 Tax=Marinospirillum alkaliphilum DSM 21637 TaxID=1122209 RepID=A0A1K1TTI6_9GAMM|nr:outer membrane lipoprotein chaperone LolA [Marinospirillum alkaliphilum]SFX04097.1 outer membrane lipoprotein carrier protein [Marinospirillum alkaliphilum DSM 21637]